MEWVSFVHPFAEIAIGLWFTVILNYNTMNLSNVFFRRCKEKFAGTPGKRDDNSVSGLDSGFPGEGPRNCRSLGSPGFPVESCGFGHCVWFSLRRTACVVAGESGEVGNPGTHRRKTFPRRGIHTEISPLRCAPVEMTKERAALPGREVAE
jgi:hypothetical protein